MALDTFAPNPGPSPGTLVNTKPKLLESNFGDGYTQAAADGTNWLKRTVQLRWDGLTPSQKATIEGFFIAKGGFTPFYYTIAYESSPTRWVCKTWKCTLDGVWQITASFTEYFGVLT